MTYIGNSCKAAEKVMLISVSADFREVIEYHRRADAEYHVISEVYQPGTELRHAFFTQICEFCLILSDLC